MTETKPFTEIIRHFTPAWFAIGMGVGVHVTMFHLFPFPAGHQTVLDIIATCLLVFNIILFIVMTSMTVAEYVMFPQVWGLMIHDPVQSLFLGTFPMALATILNGLVVEAYTRWKMAGPAFLYFIWGVWWFDVALSVLSCFGMLSIMIGRHQPELKMASAVWLLPIVPMIVTGTTGAVIATALKDVQPYYALVTTFTAVTMILMGLSISLIVLTVYSSRLIAYGFPTGGLSMTIFIPLGPLGQGGFGLLLVGDLLVELLPQSTSTANYLVTAGVAQMVRAVAFVVAYCLWVFGIFFIIPAVTTLLSSKRTSIGLPWWGLIFPTGVYTLLTIQLGRTLDSTFFKILGSIYAVLVFAIFTILSTQTLILIRKGTIFHAPYLDGNPMNMRSDATVDVGGDSGTQMEFVTMAADGERGKTQAASAWK